MNNNSRERNFIPGSKWLLNNNINGYKNFEGNELATQGSSGRKFAITNNSHLSSYSSVSMKRVRVRLLEDNYTCWFNINDIANKVTEINYWKPSLLSKNEIKQKIPKILTWIEKAANQPNHYLWGGTIGPNFDCSGLIQAAFSREGIWLPRDAYQQERFCKKLNFNPSTLKEIIPGDLIFFGISERCSHVGIYIGKGDYWHSSGKENGRDGIGRDNLRIISQDAISSHYLSILRGAGRVENCHNGASLL